MSTLFTRALVLLLAAAAPRLAAAQEGSPTERFQASTAAAEAAYAAGRYADAVDRYLDAYEIIPSPDVIYNVAFLYDQHLAKPDMARTWYERVVRDPSAKADLVRRAGERLAAIDARAAATTPRLEAAPPPPTTQATTSAPPPAPAPPQRRSAAPWAMAGAGGALVVGGVAVGLVARGTHQDYLGQSDVDAMRDLAGEGKTQAVVSDALWISGAVVAVAGLGWGIATNTRRPTAVTHHLRVVPGPGQLTVAATF